LCSIQRIGTTTACGKLLFHVLAAIAESERDLIRERTRDCLAATKGAAR
jgi:DNA invertase Pin-like site-specific DNA recombinase